MSKNGVEDYDFMLFQAHSSCVALNFPYRSECCVYLRKIIYVGAFLRQPSRWFDKGETKQQIEKDSR